MKLFTISRNVIKLDEIIKKKKVYKLIIYKYELYDILSETKYSHIMISNIALFV